ncbi:serine hydrolase domain-containing protein [Microbacterium dextranolyticum]|uniref:serine hydrolase domain-containing protein n=1 Tax=Microbacterium dextranolyticum TaxID=36806 RepID=UPI00195EF0BC|nr:serine hydrolase domain-containing protein [Microbacterium dextranolyticum]MBM7461769.1 D-alanyl-D-alanine carboxypeptidase [Microbacterium dextranolyticum]
MARPHRMRRFAAAAVATVFAATLVACSPQASVTVHLPSQVDAALPDDAQAQLQTAVTRAVAASGATGAIVGVWAPWAGTWLAGVGTLGPDGAATTTDAGFPAGAITRPMTCDILYGLVADGTVHLDDPVGTYVPGMIGHESVTLEQLCDSTSGLGSYTPALAGRFMSNPDRTWKPRELVGFGTGLNVTGQPGAGFADSDTGYVLLGMALERASGRTAAQLLDTYVFHPTGMGSSSLPQDADPDLVGLWSPDAQGGGVACTAPTVVGPLSPSAGFTASGVISDLTDLGRYTQALATGGRSYDAPGRFETTLPAAADAPSWFTATGGAYQAGSLIGQYGSTLGYLTAAFADRNTGMTVVVVLNNSRGSAVIARSLAWQLAAVASKLPAAAGQTTPDAGLPWTADDMGAQVTAAAVCPIP